MHISFIHRQSTYTVLEALYVYTFLVKLICSGTTYSMDVESSRNDVRNYKICFFYRSAMKHILCWWIKVIHLGCRLSLVSFAIVMCDARFKVALDLLRAEELKLNVFKLCAQPLLLRLRPPPSKNMPRNKNKKYNCYCCSTSTFGTYLYKLIHSEQKIPNNNNKQNKCRAHEKSERTSAVNKNDERRKDKDVKKQLAELFSEIIILRWHGLRFIKFKLINLIKFIERCLCCECGEFI